MTVQKPYYNIPPATKVAKVIDRLFDANREAENILIRARLSDGDVQFIRRKQMEIEDIADSLERNLVKRYDRMRKMREIRKFGDKGW